MADLDPVEEPKEGGPGPRPSEVVRVRLPLQFAAELRKSAARRGLDLEQILREIAIVWMIEQRQADAPRRPVTGDVAGIDPAGPEHDLVL